MMGILQKRLGSCLGKMNTQIKVSPTQVHEQMYNSSYLASQCEFFEVLDAFG